MSWVPVSSNPKVPLRAPNHAQTTLVPKGPDRGAAALGSAAIGSIEGISTAVVKKFAKGSQKVRFHGLNRSRNSIFCRSLEPDVELCASVFEGLRPSQKVNQDHIALEVPLSLRKRSRSVKTEANED